MKKIIIGCLSLVVLTGSMFAQGTVLFVTSTLGTSAKVTDTVEAGGALLSGTGFYSQLWAANGTLANDSTLAAVSYLAQFRTSANAGYVSVSGTPVGAGNNVLISTTTVNASTAAGAVVTVQLRAWSSSFATYADALTAFNAGNTAAHLGKSPLLTLTLGGGLNPPPTMIGLQGFQLVQAAPIPEPSTVVLGAFGILAAWMIRRRK